MRDNIFERDGHGDAGRDRPNRASDQSPMSDREVPLAPVGTSDTINRWLDGELPEPTGIRGDAAKSVEFWRRIGEETERRRRMVTPAHIPAKIMAALPSEMAERVVTPWWRKRVEVTTVTAIAAAAGLFALGMMVMNALRVR